MKRLVVLGAATLFALVLSVDVNAATLYSQSNVLRGNDTGNNCSGGSKGSCKVIETGAVGTSATQADNIKVQCTLKNATPNRTYTVYWTCTETARGCHTQACGFISLGTVTTTSTGKGKFVATKGNNPYPGKYVHLDLIGGSDLYTSVYAGVPIGVGPAVGTDSGQPGDPAMQ